MPRKTEQIQIRVTSGEKAALKRHARQAGQGISAYVLSRALPGSRLRFEEIVRALVRGRDHRFALAELHDLLAGASAAELNQLAEAPPPDLSRLSPLRANYLAAMIEQAAKRRGTAPPRWLRDIPALEEPHFATDLPGLRPHLLRASPVPFRRRNIFVDSSVGDRV